MSSDLASLRPLEIPQRAWFETGNGGLVRLTIKTAVAEAEIYLHGAHVARYQRTQERPLLFMSAASHFAPGKPIRGGIPLIFPWFGALAGHPAAPAHGFARTAAWTVDSLQNANDQVTVVLSLKDSADTLPNFPHAFALRYTVVVGATLSLSLEVENRSTTPFNFEEALHTYFTVSDSRAIAVSGLAGCEYIDKVDAGTRKTQGADPITITGETDRVYLNTRSTCGINDPGFARQISVAKQGSDTTVVWNPWIAKAKAMADFGDDEWPGMVCVETANAGDNRVTLAPGATHTLSAVIS